MDQFIREVDEEYRRDQIAQIWRRFSGLIVGLAILLVACVGGWRYWQYAQAQRAGVAAQRFEDALKLSRDGKPDDSEKALAALAVDAPAGYALLARFRAAAESGARDAEAGARAYDALAAEASVPALLQDLARLRGAMLRLGTGDGTAATALERLAVPTNAWRHTARELLGLAALRRGEYEGAGRWFDGIAADPETPQSLRGRLEIYTALVAGGPVQTTQ